MVAACADTNDAGADRGRIDFSASIPALEAVEVDSGPVEVADGVSMRTVATFETFWDIEASGVARGQTVEPIDDTGSISARGQLTIDVYATVTLPGEEFDGLAGTRTLDIETEVSSFDPFLIDEPQILGMDLPSELEVRVDPASGFGLAFVVEVGMALVPTYEGVCLGVDQAAEAAQYTVLLQPFGDFKYLYAVELVTPVDRTRLGAVGVDLDFSDLGVEVDLGTYSLDDGEPVQGSTPCQ